MKPSAPHPQQPILAGQPMYSQTPPTLPQAPVQHRGIEGFWDLSLRAHTHTSLLPGSSQSHQKGKAPQ